MPAKDGPSLLTPGSVEWQTAQLSLKTVGPSSARAASTVSTSRRPAAATPARTIIIVMRSAQPASGRTVSCDGFDLNGSNVVVWPCLSVATTLLPKLPVG